MIGILKDQYKKLTDTRVGCRTLLTGPGYVYILLIMDTEISDIETSELVEVAQNCLCSNIRQATRLITQVYDEFLQPSGLRSTQFSLLAAVALAHEMPLTRLAEMLVLDRTTLTRNLKPLERDGLLVIEAATDRRVHPIRMTPHGLQVLKAALPCWRQAQERIKALLGRDDWDVLSARLQMAMERISSS